MEFNNNIIRINNNKRNEMISYFNNIENNHNSSFCSESMANDKSNSINSSNIFEQKMKLNPIKYETLNKISLLKPQINSFRNYFFHKSALNKNNKVKKNYFLNLSANFEENKKIVISPKVRIPKNINIKKSLFNFSKINNQTINKEILKRLKGKTSFHNLGGNFIERNKYFTDFVKCDINDKSKILVEKKDWEKIAEKIIKKSKEQNNMKNKDIKIEKLAKELNLFQNKENLRNINLKKNNSFIRLLNKIKLPEENNNSNLIGINKKKNLNHSFSHISRKSSLTPSSRISKNIINNFNNVNINMLNFDKNKMNNILYQKEIKNLILNENKNKYNNEGINIMSPYDSKEKDNMLYKKIFYHYNKKISKTSKYIDNKLNILYAENEKQFDENVMNVNYLKKNFGKRKIIKIGKSDEEIKAEYINSKVDFIKKIFDYAYPDIFLRRLKHENNLNKNINSLKKNELNENMRNKIIEKRKMLLNSMRIEKL